MKPPCAADWFGQPRGLTILFLTEMWEKFSFYGMRALLVYYMTQQLLMQQERASLLYGLYSGFVYFTPILGGVLSDRWLGRRKSVLIGGSIMALGHFMMTAESLFLPALATIAIGNGLFLPSLPSQIGSIYHRDDPRRTSAYSIYYVGINLGAFLAPLVCGTLGELYGWHIGFGAAGVGMVLGLVIYVAGNRHLPAEPEFIRNKAFVTNEATSERGSARLFTLLLAIAAAVVVFRGAYEQVGNTVALWAHEGVDRTISSGLYVPMTWFQSLNPLLVFLLTPVLVARWARRAKAGRQTSDLARMATGAMTVALAYLLLAIISAWSAEEGTYASWLWLVAFFVVMTLGELYILPVGLGLFGRLAPSRMTATVIAVWFLAAFAGNLLAGILGSLWSRLSQGEFFALIGSIAAAAALLLRLLAGAASRFEHSAANASASAAFTAEGLEVTKNSSNGVRS